MRKNVWLLIGSMGFMCTAHAQQTLPFAERVAEIVAEMVAIQDAADGAEALTAYYQDLADHPVNLNTATHDDLAQLGFLSAFQIISLLDYRKVQGALFSWNELPLIAGFTSEDVPVLSLFFTLEDPDYKDSMRIPDIWKESRHQLLAGTRTVFPRDSHYAPVTAQEYEKHPNSRYLGVPWTRYLKYTGTYGKQLQWGFTIESDAGERALADFGSFHLMLRDRGRLQRLVIGDFQARFGQGLVLWKGVTFAQGAAGADWNWQEMGLAASLSRQENTALRGAGATWGLGHWKTSTFASFRKLDARMGPEGFTSLPSDGYHRTSSELERKNTLGAWVAGANASYTGEWFKAGFTAAVYGYSRPDATQVKYYNRYRNRKLPFGAAGPYAEWRGGSLRLFAEAAVDLGGNLAALTGMQHYTSGGWSNALVARFFGAGYTSAYGASLGLNTTSANEYSLQWNTTLSLKGGGNLSGIAYVAGFPKPRYLCDRPSYGWRFRLLWSLPQGQVLLQQQHTLVTAGAEDLIKGRVHRTVPLGGGFILASRVEAACCLYTDAPCVWGAMVYAEGKYATENKRFQASVRVAAYHADAWDARLYAYETDVLYGFSVPALYGRGWRGYAVCRYSPFAWADVWVKVGTTLSEAAKTEAKVQVRLIFGRGTKTFSHNDID